MFMSDEIYIEKLKEDAIALFEKSGDSIFTNHMSLARIIISSMVFFKKNKLSGEEREEFGYFDDVQRCFESITREDWINSILYLISNYTYSIDSEKLSGQILSDAFNVAVVAYERTYSGNEKTDVLKTFKENKESAIRQTEEQMDEEKFFNLFQELLIYKMTYKEKKYIKKTLGKKFNDLVVWDIVDVKKKVEKEIKDAKNKKVIQTVHDRISKKKLNSVGA